MSAALSHYSITEPGRIGAKGIDKFFLHVSGGSQEELFGQLVVFVDRSAIGAAQLNRVGNNPRQHGFEIQSGADCWPTSPKALSSPTERVNSLVRSSNSLNSRTFSMAITAWSAKVLRSAICLSVNGRTSVRRTAMYPMATPSRNSGVLRLVRVPVSCCGILASGYSVSISARISWI